MKLARRLSFFTAAFILGTGGSLAVFNRIGLFEVTSIPIEIAPIDPASAVRGSTLGPSGLKSRLEVALAKYTAKSPPNSRQEGRRKRVWEINLSDVKASVVREEWVKDVLISRSFPNQINVKIVPKVPVLVLINSKGSGQATLHPITEDGSLLSALPSDALPDVPLLRGEIFARDAAKRETVVNFVGELPETGLLSRRNISEIAWTQEDGYSLTLMQPKIEVKIGDDRLSLKVLRVSQVLSYMSMNQLKGHVIDASFSKKVLVRLRKGP